MKKITIYMQKYKIWSNLYLNLIWFEEYIFENFFLYYVNNQLLHLTLLTNPNSKSLNFRNLSRTTTYIHTYVHTQYESEGVNTVARDTRKLCGELTIPTSI